MKVEDFNKRLNEDLKSYKQKYERQGEGLVYIGLPDFNFSHLTKNEKIYFVYYLSFFVAFDLLVFTYYNENYLVQKDKLKIPKFEYGLTNTFVQPSKIYEKYSEPFRHEIFKKVFQQGMEYLNLKISEIKPIEIISKALTDKDFSNGRFNDELKSEINNYINIS
jgi:hypothetical protein